MSVQLRSRADRELAVARSRLLTAGVGQATVPRHDEANGPFQIWANVKRLFGVFRAGLTITTVVVVVLFAAPLAVDAQPAGTPVKIGVLSSQSRETSLAAWTAFRQGLRELGWVEGRNILVEMRLADGKLDRLPRLARELLSLNVSLIVMDGRPTSRSNGPAARVARPPAAGRRR